MVGANALHGPHHSAEKSTSTGISLSITSFCQLTFVRWTRLALPRWVSLLAEPKRESHDMKTINPPPRSSPMRSSHGGDGAFVGWFMGVLVGGQRTKAITLLAMRYRWPWQVHFRRPGRPRSRPAYHCP